MKRLSDIQNSWLFLIYIFKQFISSCAAEVGLSWLIIGQINARQWLCSEDFGRLRWMVGLNACQQMFDMANQQLGTVDEKLDK